MSAMDTTVVFKGVIAGVETGIATLLNDEELDVKARGRLRLMRVYMAILESTFRHVFEAGIAYGKGEPLPDVSNPYVEGGGDHV